MTNKVSNDVSKSFIAVDYAAKKEPWMGRHVQWIKKDDGKVKNFFKDCLAAIEIVFAALSIVGIYFIVKGVSKSNQIDNEKKFASLVAKLTPPPAGMPLIELKSAHASFNHVQEFVIKDKVIWERRRDPAHLPWKPVYFDGFAEKKDPVELHCDGANLIVLDDDRSVHYKKVLHEYRASELTNEKFKKANHGRRVMLAAAKSLGISTVNFNENLKKHLGIDETHKEGKYVAVDKGDKNNWKNKWFSLPVVSDFVNLFKGNRIKIDPQARAWAISHRGRYNDHYKDAAGVKHPVDAGVTTLYVLAENGKEIYKFDPWSPPDADMNIAITDEVDKNYTAENLSASASTIMLIGYEAMPSAEGGTVKTLKIKTKLADIDTEGWNPGLKYSYFHEHGGKKRRVVDYAAKWEEHPLNLKPGEAVTKNITIVQTGEDIARELRVEGRKDNQSGYFYKSITDKEWKFKSYAGAVSAEHLHTLKPTIVSEEEFQKTVVDFTLDTASLPKNMLMQVQGQLKRFGPHAYNSDLMMKLGGQEYKLVLHKRKSLGNFLGIKKDRYDLIVPTEYHNDPNIKMLFPKGFAQKVKVKHFESKLTVVAPKFQFTFNEVA